MFVRILHSVPRSLVVALFLLVSLVALAESGAGVDARAGAPVIDAAVLATAPAPPPPPGIVVAVIRGGEI